MGLFITFLLGLFFLIGVAVIKLASDKERIEHFSIALAFGSMTALVFFDLLPELFETFNAKNYLGVILSVLAGILVLKLLDSFIPDHDGHLKEEQTNKEHNMVHIGIISAIAIVLHNAVEGMSVYSITMESLRQGALLSLGVGLHNIPMGMLIYATLEKENRTKRHIVICAASLSTFLGGLLMALIRPFLSEFVIGILIGIALGMILYILIFELIPHLLRQKKWKVSLLGTILGILIIFTSFLF